VVFHQHRHGHRRRGANTITGQTSFANSGTIDLQDGAVGDVLTINGAFVGSGGSNLAIDFTGTAADTLVINGAASGTTTVNVTPVAISSSIRPACWWSTPLRPRRARSCSELPLSASSTSTWRRSGRTSS
jgi:hypothetical protein